jgi:hypothetical protein
MEAVAIISHLLHYVLAAAALYFCVTLYRHRRVWGWLLLSTVFLEPFYLLFVRAIRGRPLLTYKSVSAGSDGIMQVSYRLDFPFFYILAVLGLFLIFRQAQTKIGGHDDVV